MISKKGLSNDLLDVILNTVSDGVTVIDTNLKIQYRNKVISRLFGARKGEYCYEVYRNRNTPCENCKVIEVLKDGKERRMIEDVHLPDGEVRLVEATSAPIRDAEGKIIGAVEIARDVTDQKKAEALLNKNFIEQSKNLRKLTKELSNAEGYIKTVLPKQINSGPLLADWIFIPSVSLGGDAFGYHWIDNNNFAIYLIDVSGHGWGAALLSVSVINVLRAQSLPGTDFHNPENVLFSLNNAFPSERHNDMFFTIWYGVYNRRSETLLYSTGGHPPGLLITNSPTGNVDLLELKTPGFIVGGRSDVTYYNREQKMINPSRLIIFSDGVYEISKEDNSTGGLKEFINFIKNHANQIKPSLDVIENYARELNKNKTFDDDFTILELIVK